MKSDSFWALIPKGVKVAAAVVFVCALIAGPLIGAWQGHMAGLEYHERHPSGSVAVRDWIGHGPGGRRMRRLLAAVHWIRLCRCASPLHARRSLGPGLYLRSQPAWISALLCDTPPAGIAMLKLRPVGCR